MTPGRRHQRGIGLIGVLFLIVVAGFVLNIAFKLGPHYMDYLTVRSVMRDISADPSLADAGKTKVLEALQNRLYINSVRGIGTQAFKLTRTGAGDLLSADYQVQEHVLANVDAVLTFNHEVTLDRK